jgi:prepilin-type N-terminal cleavage/methylation domain-containing protein
MKLKKAFSLIELSIVILIIGILIAGVTQSSRLVAKMRLASARALTQSSPAASVKDLVAWLETTSEKSFDDAESQDGTAVTNWYDINPQRSIKYNATTSIVADKPTYVENGINNLPVLSGNGTSNVMLLSGLTDSFVDSGFTWIGVLQWRVPGVGPKGYIGLKSQTGSGSNQGVTLFLDDWNALPTSLRVVSRNDGTLNTNQITSSSINQYQTHVVSVVRSTTSLSAYDNGTQLGSTISDATTNGIFNSTAPWAVFKYTNDNVQYFFGYVGEYIIFSRPLKNEERRAIEIYLGKKWGVKIS